jgi:hypothetical protein
VRDWPNFSDSRLISYAADWAFTTNAQGSGMAPGERAAFLQHAERTAQAAYDQETLWSVEAYRQIFEGSAPKPSKT